MQLIAKGGNDNINTPISLAKSIIDHYKPYGIILEPCFGDGAFFNNYPKTDGIENLWCEINKGIDFFNFDKKVNWIITNPPFSILRAFLRHSMRVADNIVFLSLINAYFQNAKLNDLEEFGFGIKEILYIPKEKCPTEEDGWPSFGMSIGATYIQKGYSGDIKFSKL